MQSNTDDGNRPMRRPALRPSAATLTGALAAALVPQTVDAALVTVGGDGGTGPVTLENPGDTTDIGGLLQTSISYFTFSSDRRLAKFRTLRGPELWNAVRSNRSTFAGLLPNGSIWGFIRGLNGITQASEGAVLDSDDNWVPGRFRVNGVADGNLIWGWLQVRLGGSPGSFNPTILSFTYDDEATDDTQFAKPVGGFEVPETDPVPEPSTLGLLGLGLGAAFVSRMRRRKRVG